jgi:hypothetical protein
MLGISELGAGAGAVTILSWRIETRFKPVLLGRRPKVECTSLQQ